MKKGGGIAVMPADVDISLFAFFKIFFIIHFIRNNFRKKIRNHYRIVGNDYRLAEWIRIK